MVALITGGELPSTDETSPSGRAGAFLHGLLHERSIESIPDPSAVSALRRIVGRLASAGHVELCRKMAGAMGEQL